MDNKRRKYTKEFKQEAVRLVAVGDRSPATLVQANYVGGKVGLNTGTGQLCWGKGRPSR
jgi:hypothetical protein